MMKAPEKCCEIGTYECTVPMPIKGRLRGIDFCLADLVAALNAANITTAASCCGHGKFIGSIMLEDDRVLEVYPNVDVRTEHRKKHAFPKACLRKGMSDETA